MHARAQQRMITQRREGDGFRAAATTTTPQVVNACFTCFTYMHALRE